MEVGVEITLSLDYISDVVVGVLVWGRDVGLWLTFYLTYYVFLTFWLQSKAGTEIGFSNMTSHKETEPK